MTQSGKAELLTDEFRVCARKAAKWAAAGFIISIEPPSSDDTNQGEQRNQNSGNYYYSSFVVVLSVVMSSGRNYQLSLLYIGNTVSSTLGGQSPRI